MNNAAITVSVIVFVVVVLLSITVDGDHALLMMVNIYCRRRLTRSKTDGNGAGYTRWSFATFQLLPWL